MATKVKQQKLGKRQRNAIITRIESAIAMYGFEDVRLVWNRYLADIREREKLKKEVEDKERALAELKKR